MRKARERKSTEERFWMHVDRKSDDECWEWMGSKLRGGYGNLNVDGHTMQAHRLSYIIHKGEIPIGKMICHHCDNPGCVNPNHLFLGDHLINAKDRCNKSRQAKEETCGNLKFSKDVVKSIRQEYSIGGVSMRSLSRKYKVTYSHVNAILHGTSRKYAY